MIGHGAVLNGRRIGSNVLIGMNATVLHDSEIGNECIVAAGCLVGQGMIVPDRSPGGGRAGANSGRTHRGSALVGPRGVEGV